MCWYRGNVREVGVQGNVGRSVGKCVRVDDSGGKRGGSEKMLGEV